MTINLVQSVNSLSHSTELDQQCVDDAKTLAKYLETLGKIHHPRISATTDGEIYFSWRKDGFILDLGVCGDGNYSCYAHLLSGKEIEIIEDSVLLCVPLLPKILDYIIV